MNNKTRFAIAVGVILPAVLLLLKPSADKVPSDLRDAVNSPTEQLGLSETPAQPGEKGYIKPPPPPPQAPAEPAPAPCPASWLDGKAKPGKPVQWVMLRGGEFTMGTNDKYNMFNNARPIHKVGIKPFSISKTEVTVGQYRECYAKGECTCPDVALKTEASDAPITGITWEQAKRYAKFAGGRLPTEAEWEYAATNEGKNVMYPWGNPVDHHGKPDDYNFQFDPCGKGFAVAQKELLGYPYLVAGCEQGMKPWPVCSMPKGNTAQGLCDMAGNVAEWVEDNYSPSYEGAPSDGSAVVVAGSKKHVNRGGHLDLDGLFLRSDYRGYGHEGADPLIGFRIAKDLE